MKRKPNTILLVEDDETSRRLIRAILQYEGYKINLAEDLEQARGFLREIVPGLVLLDIRLKGHDGLELAREMRGNHHLEKVPIIAVTAQALRGDEDRIRAAGVNAYIPKPVDTRRLRRTVVDLMQGEEGGAG